MDVELLTIPDCPHRSTALARLHEALEATGATTTAIVERVIVDRQEAATAGMHGSPTVLIDGRDAFEVDGDVGSMSCRLYRTAQGTEGAPGVDDLVGVLRRRGAGR